MAKKEQILELLNAYKSEVDNFNDAIFTDKFEVLTQDIVKLFAIPSVSNSRFVSGTCEGEKCSVCGENATNKLGEEIPHDDPNPNRHNLTAYVCREHFRMIVGKLG